MFKLLSLCVFLLLMFSNCSESCDGEFTNIATYLDVESSAWRAATDAYNENPSIVNCEELNRTSDIYIQAVMDASGCIKDNDEEAYDGFLSFMEAQKIENCN